MNGPGSRGKPGTRFGAIHIMDTGSGMDRQTMDQIFEPFFSTKDVGRGAGLGLAIAYGIVEQHGGLMDVTSSPGEGTESSIFPPLVEAVSGGAEKEQQRKSGNPPGFAVSS